MAGTPAEDVMTGTNWSRNDSFVGGYPVYHTCISYPTAFNVNESYTLWTLDSQYAGYPHSASQCPAFSVAESFSPWSQDSNIFEGYWKPRSVADIARMGAFAYCENLASVSIPLSVTQLGNYTFYGTDISSITVAPDVKVSKSCIPAGCTISFYQASFTVTLPDSEIVFTQGDDYVSYLNQTMFSMTVTDGTNTVTRLVPFTITGVSTSEVVEDATGYLVFTYGDGVTKYNYQFTYSVTASA